ncbi:MAG: hypothetical protein IPN33_14630 [Saprospiraceae bacterium]|nr:hypothetical protein [Saprospiraceae bacterium]
MAPAATAAFSVSAAQICGPDSLLLLTNASTNSNGNYSWSITPNSGFSFVNGTNASSANPQLQFTEEDSYTIQLQVNACGEPTALQTVTVRLSPDATLITDTPNGCESVTINPAQHIVLSGGASDSVVWTLPAAAYPALAAPTHRR